jgi:hypothetical protein
MISDQTISTRPYAVILQSNNRWQVYRLNDRTNLLAGSTLIKTLDTVEEVFGFVDSNSLDVLILISED